MNCCPEPSDMRMPKKCASLACDGEIVDIALPGLYWALGDICRPICPTSPKLSDSVPAVNYHNQINIYGHIGGSVIYRLTEIQTRKINLMIIRPVDCNVVLDVVDDPYNHRIILPCQESRPWELPIDCNNRLCCTKSCCILQHHLNTAAKQIEHGISFGKTNVNE